VPFTSPRRESYNAKKLFWTLIPAVAFVTLIFSVFLTLHRDTNQLPVASILNANLGTPRNQRYLGEADIVKEFESFVDRFRKAYITAEEKMSRFDIFKSNFAYIMNHNSQGHKYTLAVNRFADMTAEEFKSKYVGYRRTSPRQPAQKLFTATQYNASELPESVNWFEKGCVDPVKDQQQCGSCWAFSAVGSLVGAICAKTGKLYDLSEQQLVDCAQKEGALGCSGGEMDQAFQYVIDNGGLCSEKDYPYTGVNGNQCLASKCKPIGGTISGFQDVPKEDETALMHAVANFGPVAVAIEADQTSFQFYEGGVFDGACGANLDHGVLLVGYGTDETSKEDYWLVKNSWGAAWGDRGFIKLARKKGKAGQCGILEDPSYPIV